MLNDKSENKKIPQFLRQKRLLRVWIWVLGSFTQSRKEFRNGA